MSLEVKRQEAPGGIPVFIKILELFTGGFSLVTTGFNTGVKLPAGALLKVDEVERTATPVKTAAVPTAGASGTVLYIEPGHHFSQGDIVARAVGGVATGIASIVDGTGDFTGWDKVTVATSIATAEKGDVLFEAAAASSTAAVKTVANTLNRYEVYMESGAGVSGVRRATAYKNRVQPFVTEHVADLDGSVLFSNSK